jgi:hypothetical protein
MDWSARLEQLGQLQHLVELRDAATGDEARRLQQELSIAHGEVSDVFRDVLGDQRVEVPVAGAGARPAKYPNYFEAGYLSGRSFHTGHRRSELLKVIGIVKQRATRPVQRAAQHIGGPRVFWYMDTTKPHCIPSLAFSKS